MALYSHSVQKENNFFRNFFFKFDKYSLNVWSEVVGESKLLILKFKNCEDVNELKAFKG